MPNILTPIGQSFTNKPNIAATYGPYASIAAAHVALSDDNLNIIGMTVGIQVDANHIEEYWYQGGTTQAHLVKKQMDEDIPASALAGDIPASKLSGGVQTSLGKADTAYQKPGTGIPASDLASAVQTSLGKADTAYQKPGTGIPASDLASAVQTSLGKADTAFQKPGTGIPASDLASAVQTSLGKADTAVQPADIAALDGNPTGTSADGHVSVQVTEVDGVVNAVNVTTNDIASASALAGEVSRAQGAESALDAAKADKATTLYGYGITNAYTKSEVDGMVSTPHQNYVTVADYASLPATGSDDTIYRVSCWDGAYNSGAGQVDNTKYTEYAWNGTAYVLLRVMDATAEVFDISAYNNATYDDLTDALGVSGANVPADLRAGGMSVKFINTATNKYEQYRLMSATWSTTVSDWQGVDDEPTAGSDNLVKSGGVGIKLQGVTATENNVVINPLTDVHDGYVDYLGNIQTSSGWKYVQVDVTGADKVRFLGVERTGSTASYYAFYDNNGDLIGSAIAMDKGADSNRIKEYIASVPSNAKYLKTLYQWSSVPGLPDAFYCYLQNGYPAASTFRTGEFIGDFGIANTPVKGSNDLLMSGGAFAANASMMNCPLTQGIQYNLTVGSKYTTLTNQSWYAAKIMAVEGAVFSISGKGGSSIVLWGTLDRNGICIRKSAASLDTRSNPVDITLESGECYIVMNTSVSDSSLTLKNLAVTELVGYDSIKSLEKYKDFRSTFCLWGYLGTTTGDLIDRTGEYNGLYQSTDFIAVDTRDTINYNIYHSTNGGSQAEPHFLGGGIYCYDANQVFIDRYVITHNGRMMMGSVSVEDLPQGTAYIRVMREINDDSYIYGVRAGAQVSQKMGNKGILLPKNRLPMYVNMSSFTSINNAIQQLHELGGGVLKLGDMEITGAVEIGLNYGDVSIEGSGVTKTKLWGSGVAAISVGDGVTCASISNLWIKSYKVKKGCQLILNNCRVGDEMIDGIAPSVYHIAASNTSDNLKSLVFDVIDTATDASTTINSALANYDILYLYTGTYNISSPIIPHSGNKILHVGSGRCTINRSGNGYCVKVADNSDGTYIEKCTFSNRFVSLTSGNSHNGELVDCVINGSVIPYVYVGKPGVNDINCGADKGVTKFTDALRIANLDVPSDVKNRICVYGVIEETITDSIAINSSSQAWIIGMTPNAEIRLTKNTVGSAIVFRDYNGTALNGIIKDLTFSMYGSAGGYQYGTITVRSNNCYFENCKFLNYQTCADSYDPSLDTQNNPLDGDRKHGCYVLINDEINVYDDDCHTEFHDCLAVGSPYGHKNCRGWYISKGSPKLYNCKGIGGGVGRYGYGFVLHHSSKPYLYNCIGIGSPYGWDTCNGFNFQMSTAAKLFNCIGFGGTGYQHKSNGGTDIVNQGTISGASHGFGSAMRVTPTLVDCVGYAGDGDGSCGIFFGYNNEANVIGGFFGKDMKVYCTPFTKDSGEYYMTLSLGNDNRPIELVDVGIRDLSGMTSGQRIVFMNGSGNIILEATQITQQQNATIFNKYIDANDVITCHVLDSNDQDVTSTVNFDILVRLMVSNSMFACQVDSTANPKLHKAVLTGNDEADGVMLESSTSDYLIDDCMIDVKNDRFAVKSSSSKSNVRIVNCIMTTNNTDNISSFVQTTQLGSNTIVV